jgi:hypothetical protein
MSLRIRRGISGYSFEILDLTCDLKSNRQRPKQVTSRGSFSTATTIQNQVAEVTNDNTPES